jgi:hypothetical protein
VEILLKVTIELVPHGIEAYSEVLDTVFISNDGTALATGPNEGGIGNYEVHDNETLEHLHTVDYPRMYACGFIKGVERSPEHRLFLAEQALGIVQESRRNREAGDERYEVTRDV